MMSGSSFSVYRTPRRFWPSGEPVDVMVYHIVCVHEQNGIKAVEGRMNKDSVLVEENLSREAAQKVVDDMNVVREVMAT